MSPNVIIALKDLWACAATTHNLRVLTPWIHYECPPSYRVFEIGEQNPVYDLYNKETLDDGTPVYEGRFLDAQAFREGTKEMTFRVASPEAFFKMVESRVKASSFQIQLTVAEHREFLQYIRDTFPEEVFDTFNMLACWQCYAARPLVGRTLASLSGVEAASLPDNLTLYGLRNKGGQWWKTIGGDKPVSLATLQADDYEGSKRIMGFKFPPLVRSVK